MLKVKQIKPRDNYLLFVELSNGKTGLFDVKPYLEKGIFTELKNRDYFLAARPAFGGVVWPNEQDFSVDTIAAEMK